MKKRIISFILAFVLVLGLLPMGAVSASAAVTTTSDKAIEFIKEWEGYRASAYADGKNADGSQRYSIGYGTSCKVDEYPNGISKAVATDLLKEHLAEVVEPAVVSFATKYSLSLSQQQFDALVSISYNCGTAWLQETGTLRTAVISGLKGNSFLYAMGLWSTNGGAIDTNLVKRRLAEADMFLNGSYTKNARSNYTYVLLDTDGDGNEDKIQAYDAKVPTTINVTPTKTGSTFLGWYNSNTTGGWEIKQLDYTTAERLLFAKWQAADATETAVSQYTIKVSELADKTPYVNHESGTAEVTGITLKDTDTITVTHEYVDSASNKWVKATIGSKTAWFELGNVNEYVAVNNQVTVTVVSNTLNVRTGPSTDTAAMAKLKKGDKVLIVATSADGNSTWGQIGEGDNKGYWICLDKEYTNYAEAVKAQNGATSGNSVIATGKVIATTLNIRSAATITSAALKTTLKQDDTVQILAIQNDGSKTWGKIAVDGGYGWINLAYVDLNAAEEEDKDNTTTTPVVPETKTGVIANTDNVNIREKAGARNKLVKTLPRGTKVTVYETTTQDNAPWGRIGTNEWVAMMYVTLDATTSSGSTGSTGNNSTTVIATGVVNSTMNLKVRTGPGMTYNQINSLPTGTQVSIYEETTTAGASWGRIGDGQWVCLNYVTIKTVASGSTSANGVMATVVNCANAVNIRAAAGVGNALVGVAAVNSRIKIYETTDVNGISWGRTDKGWVCMDYIQLDGPLSDGNTNTGNTGSTGSTGSTTTTTTITATVTANSLNIRKDATNTSEDIGDLKLGDKVTVLEKKTETTDSETKTWGKIEKDGVTGWINLAYTTLEEVTTNTNTNTNTGTSTESGVKTGKIINVPAGMNVNVRAAAGVTNALVTTLPNGTAVKVYEQMDVNNATWAKIDQGWVYMYYIQLDTTTSGTTGSTGTNTGTTSGTTSGKSVGIVNSNIDLNVRSGPGIDYAKVNSLKKGTQVIVYEQTLANGMLWGRIGDNQWVSLNYVTLTASSGTGTGVMGTISNCGVAVNVRSAPGVNNALVGTIMVNSRVEIYEQTLYSGQYWGRVNQGWICMQYVTLDSAQPPITDGNGTVPTTEATEATTATDATEATQATEATDATDATDATEGATNSNPEVAFSATATITTSTLNVRKDATADSEKVGEVKSGESYPVYALKVDGEKTWAQIGIIGGKGWINISYATISGSGAVTADNLNVRQEATADSEDVGDLKKGTEVSFNEIKLVGEKVWGKITAVDSTTNNSVTGWINLDYVKMGAKGYEVANPPAATLFVATTKYDIYMYSETDATKTTATVFSGNTALNITEVKVAGGEFWGKLYHEYDIGWVMLNHTTFSINGTVVASDPNVLTVYGDDLTTATGLELANGTAVKITAVKNDGTSNWACVTADTNTGWVKLDNLTSLFG